MSNDLKAKFRLYTLAEVAELLPSLKKAKAVIEDLASETGCYREFGGEMFFTEDDVIELFALARKTVKRGEPSPATEGWLIWFGSKTNPDADCMLGWTTFERMQSYIDDIKGNYCEPLDTLTFFPCTRGDYKKHLAAVSKHKSYALWHFRTREVNQYMNALVEALPGEDEESEGDQ